MPSWLEYLDLIPTKAPRRVSPMATNRPFTVLSTAQVDRLSKQFEAMWESANQGPPSLLMGQVDVFEEGYLRLSGLFDVKALRQIIVAWERELLAGSWEEKEMNGAHQS